MDKLAKHIQNVMAVIAVLTFLGEIALAMGGAYAFWKIKTNDLHHVGLGLTELSQKLDKIDDKLDIHGERISKIEGEITTLKNK